MLVDPGSNPSQSFVYLHLIFYPFSFLSLVMFMSPIIINFCASFLDNNDDYKKMIIIGHMNITKDKNVN